MFDPWGNTNNCRRHAGRITFGEETSATKQEPTNEEANSQGPWPPNCDTTRSLEDGSATRPRARVWKGTWTPPRFACCDGRWPTWAPRMAGSQSSRFSPLRRCKVTKIELLQPLWDFHNKKTTTKKSAGFSFQSDVSQVLAFIRFFPANPNLEVLLW